MFKRVHLRQFLALAEEGTFTAAARRLHVTQPTLSAGIAELERLIGTPLLLRDRRAIRLTAAGNRLLAHARTIEHEFRLAETGMAQAARPLPALVLGVLPSLPTALLQSIAKAYAGERPLALVEASDADLRRRLADARIDVALTLLRHGEEPGAVLEEGYAMALPAAHPLASRALLQPGELAAETMIARRSCEILGETSRYFTAAGVRPRFFLRSANDERCMAMVGAGLGLTTAPLSLARSAGLAAVPLAGYDYRRRIGLVAAAGAVLPQPLVEGWNAALAGMDPDGAVVGPAGFEPAT